MSDTFYFANDELTFAGQSSTDAQYSTNLDMYNTFDASLSSLPSVYQGESMALLNHNPTIVDPMLASLPRIVEPEVIIPHSHQVNTNASMQASWDSMHLQPTAYTPSRTSPIPIQRHSSHRAHPYKLPSGSPSGRSARHSPATPSPQLLRAASYPLASNSYAMSQPIQYPTTDLIRPQPPVAPPLPRRVRISQNFAGRSPSRRSLKVDFHANGVPGFRVGDALYNEANLHIDNGEDIVWANCVDRYAHLSINFPGRSGDHGAYLYTAHVDPDTKVRRAWTRKALAVETAKAILRAYYGKDNLKKAFKSRETAEIDDLWVTYVAPGSSGRWVLGLEKIESQ